MIPANATSNVTIQDQVDDKWIAVSRSGFHRNVSSVLDHIGGKTAFLAYGDGDGDGEQVRGVGLGVLEGGWLYIFGMQIRATFQRPWAGKAIVTSVFVWVLAENARGVYSQREEDNSNVCQLYPSLEFQTDYAFHYRTLFRDD